MFFAETMQQPLVNLQLFPAAVLVGAAVGFLSGLMGKGGSAITTPLLRMGLHVPRLIALASPLPATLPTTLSASFAYAQRRLVDWRAVAIASMWGCPATVFGSFASHWVGGHFLMLLTAAFVTFLGVSFLISPVTPKTQEEESVPPSGKLALVALGVGGLSGLLANSGGILFAPLFIRYLAMPTKRALATSLVVSAVLAIPGTLAHWHLGNIDWMLAFALSIGALPSSYLGARLALRLRNEVLEWVFGLLLTAFGLLDFVYTAFHPPWLL